MEDVDGNRLTDYHAAYGAILLGHAYPAVDGAVREAIADGVLYGVGTTEREVELCERIVKLVPSVESVLLTNTGNEATMNLVRLARAVTEREYIVKFQGSYNGAHDSVLRNVLSAPHLIGARDPGSAGMLNAAVDRTLVCRFNDVTDVDETFSRYGKRIAAVILEPILHNAPTILPKSDFLQHLRTTCNEWGSLLIFDEVVTGFRHHLGGYQAITNVQPDLTALSKAMGNGYPIAAFGGRRDLMERFTTATGGDVFYGGTYNANGVGVAAALATLKELETADVHNHIYTLGEAMRSGLREMTEGQGIPTRVTGYGSIYCLSFLGGDGGFAAYDDVVENDAATQIGYRQELIKRGVFEMPEGHGRNHISYSHTMGDVDRSLDIMQDALKATIAARK